MVRNIASPGVGVGRGVSSAGAAECKEAVEGLLLWTLEMSTTRLYFEALRWFDSLRIGKGTNLRRSFIRASWFLIVSFVTKVSVAG